MTVLYLKKIKTGAIDMEYNEEGIPICPICSKGADECECWDDEDVHEIISWRIAEGFIDSRHLDVRINDDEDEDEDE